MKSASLPGPATSSWTFGRDDTVWQKTKSRVAERIGGMPFDVMLALLLETAKRQVLGNN